ncbi:MAG TPA: allophanate hydrolase subunit 2 family protein, partial [Pseudonocardiaceae bacterium]|nr:allophanate hydrolase subunit 2 family protein [Pseudonocardiaceae bacterium]
MRAVTVLATGPQALVQDLGRPGHAHLGVPPSGALDEPALRLANRLVGNAESAAGVEVLLGGLRLRADCSCTVAVTGPAVPVTVGGRTRDSHTPVGLAEGDVLELGVPDGGLRAYVAVGGGIDV